MILLMLVKHSCLIHRMTFIDLFSHRYFNLWTLPLEMEYYFYVPIIVSLIIVIGPLWIVVVVGTIGFTIYRDLTVARVG